MNGVVQSNGLPTIVAVVAFWFGSHKNGGIIFGTWNSHATVGNLLGNLIASIFVGNQWGLSFFVPGIITSVYGVIIYLVMIPKPEQVGLSIDKSKEYQDIDKEEDGEAKKKVRPITCTEALKIPVT